MIMGIGKLIEEVGGAIVAEQAAEAADPNAGFLVKTAAAVAGFVGAGKLSDTLQTHADHNQDALQDAADNAANLSPDDPGPEPK
jgi:membrane protease subunit (stomatin/prohibitin family)